MTGDVEIAIFRYRGKDFVLTACDETRSGGYTAWVWQAVGPEFAACSTRGGDSAATAFGLAVEAVVGDVRWTPAAGKERE